MRNIYELIEDRSSCYEIGKNSEINLEELIEKLRRVVNKTPSAFNAQTSRIVVVTGKKNEELWDLILETQKNVLELEVFNNMKVRMENAKRGMGTILFFEDREAVQSMPTKGQRLEAYKEQNSAFVTMAIWLVLEQENLGASLQHYNIGYDETYDTGIKELLNLPKTYELMAEMPFGSKEDTSFNVKEKLDPKIRVQVIKN